MIHISNVDKTFLKLAIESATSAYHLGNYPVGAVLTIDNKVIGVGENKINENESFFEHAEMKLISKYSTVLYKAYQEKLEIKIYSTLEPCIQCLGASVTNHIDKIFYITKDPNGGACDIKHDNIGDWYRHSWPQIIYAPISKEPLSLMMKFFNNEIAKGNTNWPEKMISLYQQQNNIS